MFLIKEIKEVKNKDQWVNMVKDKDKKEIEFKVLNHNKNLKVIKMHNHQDILEI